jgi:RND family efflux transporter MFP subunit
MRLSSIHWVLLSAIAVAGCARHEPPAPGVSPVQLVRVTLGGLSNGAVFAGEVKARHEADLAFRIGGKIVARSVEAGPRVRSGQTLARLDPADVGLQAEAGKAAVAAAEAEYTFAKSEYDRYQNLFREQFVSASALEQKRNLHNAAVARLDQARAQLAVTRNQAAYATLVAPFDGIVTTIAAEVGQVVASGQSIAKLAREDEREVAISVPENRIAELAQAKRLGVFLWANPTKVYAARVREVAPSVDAVTRTFAVRVSILDADAAVQWGMTANVGLASDAGAASALLPLPSLYRKGSEPAVWVYDAQSKSVSLRPVTVAQYREDGIVVTGGLADGEWIVAAGVNKLTPGQQVRPYEGGSGALPPVAPARPTTPAAPVAARP